MLSRAAPRRRTQSACKPNLVANQRFSLACQYTKGSALRGALVCSKRRTAFTTRHFVNAHSPSTCISDAGTSNTRNSTVPYSGCGRMSQYMSFVLSTAPVSRMASQYSSNSRQLDRQTGMPEFAEGRNIRIRDETWLVSTPCQYGELAESDRRCGRYSTTSFVTPIAASPLGTPT